MSKRGSSLVVLLATGLGLGRSPIASGTFGTLLGLPLAAALCGLSWPWQAAAAAALAVLAVPICGAAEAHFGRKDDGRIVADEYLTFPLCVVGLPWVGHPWLLAVAFLTHRVMDIVKPPPARAAQHLPGGAGIVLDDVLSGLYALAANHLLARLAGASH